MVQKERSNEDQSRSILTEEERKIVKVAKEEIVKHLERKYKFSSLMPFLAMLKTEHNTRKLIWKKIYDFLGVDDKFRGKLILLFLLLILFSLIIGPSHTLEIILKWLGND